MKLHIFNPEHDMALAAHLAHFTAPHAGRQLRHDLGFLPTLWAEADDWILVDDLEAANESMRRVRIDLKGRLVEPDELKRLMAHFSHDEPLEVSPWGWDLALRQQLVEMNVPVNMLPSNGVLNVIRTVSNRGWAAVHLLPRLRDIEGTVGAAEALEDEAEAERTVLRMGRSVMKAPWSSSGRGIRYVEAGTLTPQLKGWMTNVVARQGSVMVEPYYNKVIDFGMEYSVDSNGMAHYRGLSLFSTANGAYTGSVVDSEEMKFELLSRYVDASIVTAVRRKLTALLTDELGSIYKGPLGIDMMVVDTPQGHCVHPCVELNLRNTMGHVAIGLYEKMPHQTHTFSINYIDKYRLQISK